MFIFPIFSIFKFVILWIMMFDVHFHIFRFWYIYMISRLSSCLCFLFTFHSFWISDVWFSEFQCSSFSFQSFRFSWLWFCGVFKFRLANVRVSDFHVYDLIKSEFRFSVFRFTEFQIYDDGASPNCVFYFRNRRHSSESPPRVPKPHFVELLEVTFWRKSTPN